MTQKIEFGPISLYLLREEDRLREEEVVTGIYYDLRLAINSITRHCRAAKAVAKVEDVKPIEAGFWAVEFSVFDRIPKTDHREPIFRTVGRFYDGLWDDSLNQGALLRGVPIETAYLLEEAVKEGLSAGELSGVKSDPKPTAQIDRLPTKFGKQVPQRR